MAKFRIEMVVKTVETNFLTNRVLTLVTNSANITDLSIRIWFTTYERRRNKRTGRIG